MFEVFDYIGHHVKKVGIVECSRVCVDDALPLKGCALLSPD